MSANALLTHLNTTPGDRTIIVVENELGDANFVITHLLKQIFDRSSKVCFVIWHNTIGHYQNVLKRLGVDLLKKVESGEAVVLQELKRLLDEMMGDEEATRGQLADLVFGEIKEVVERFTKDNQNVHLVIDDFSHLFDLGLGLEEVLMFVNKCVNLTNDERVSVVLGSHVSNKSNSIITRNLMYVSDVTIVVSPLKTGRSRDVTGVIDVVYNRSDKLRSGIDADTRHYKATELGIKCFAPGQSVSHLYI